MGPDLGREDDELEVGGTSTDDGLGANTTDRNDDAGDGGRLAHTAAIILDQSRTGGGGNLCQGRREGVEAGTRGSERAGVDEHLTVARASRS